MRVRMNVRQCVWILAIVLGTGITTSTLRASSASLPQDQTHAAQDQGHDQDYSKNKKYQQGLREGREDSAHNRDHSKNRHFEKDDDQKAYEAGYQQGHQGEHQK